MVNAVAQLTGLRSLCLRAALAPASSTAEALAPHATSVACFSALTALTRLELDSSRCYEFHGDRWSVMHKHGLALEDTSEVHRTSLLSALRAMPQLQHLHCPTLWLRPGEAAPLTALTTLSVGGLLPPSSPGAGPHAHLAANMEVDAAPGNEAAPAPGGHGGQGDSALEAVLPAGLQELRLSTGASPCTLAALQLPAPVRSVHCSALILGCRDVEQLECIKQEALEALGPAVRLLSKQETCCASDTVQVVVDGGPELLQPRQDTPTGHVEWLQQLAGLDAFQSLMLSGVELRAGDVGCLIRMWPNVRVSLESCFCRVWEVAHLRRRGRGTRPHFATCGTVCTARRTLKMIAIYSCETYRLAHFAPHWLIGCASIIPWMTVFMYFVSTPAVPGSEPGDADGDSAASGGAD